MRVSRGFLRSRELISPTGYDVRPTSGIVKQAMFNILGSAVQGAAVWDMFGGSGQLGIEALSCGAGSLTVTDSSRESINVINKNMAKLGLDAEVLFCGYQDAARRLASQGRKYDIIIADPPYAGGFYTGVQQAVLDCDLLAAGGVLVLEYDKALPPETLPGFAEKCDRSYGRRCIRMLVKQ